MRIKLYEPRNWQREVHNIEKRYKVIVAHRRSGKTTFALNELIYRANHKEGLYWYVAPTYKQAKMIAWDLLKKYAQPAIIKTNEVELTILIRTINGKYSKISLKGADNKDNLRGVGLSLCVLDELDYMSPKVWTEIVRPMLIDSNGSAIFIGTFKGKKQLFELSKITDNEWYSIILPASKTGLIPQEELDELKKQLPEAIYNQEIECIPLEGQGSVFKNIKSCLKDTFKPPEIGHYYYLGVDLARLVDFTVLCVIDKDTHELVAWDRFNQIDWNLQKAKIEAMARKYNNAEIVIDRTGLGDPIVEDLKRAGLNVVDFNFTSESKKKIIEKLVILIEQAKIHFPNIPELIDELETFSYELRGKNIIYSAPEGLHDDCVIALALACFNLDDKTYSILNEKKSIFDDDYMMQYGTAFKNPYQ